MKPRNKSVGVIRPQIAKPQRATRPSTGLADTYPSNETWMRFYIKDVPDGVKLIATGYRYLPSDPWTDVRPVEMRVSAYEPETRTAAWDIDPAWFTQTMTGVSGDGSPGGRATGLLTDILGRVVVRLPGYTDSPPLTIDFQGDRSVDLGDVFGVVFIDGSGDEPIQSITVDGGATIDPPFHWSDAFPVIKTEPHYVTVTWASGRVSNFEIPAFTGSEYRVRVQPLSVVFRNLPSGAYIYSRNPDGTTNQIRATMGTGYPMPLSIGTVYFRYPDGRQASRNLGASVGTIQIDASPEANGLTPPARTESPGSTPPGGRPPSGGGLRDLAPDPGRGVDGRPSGAGGGGSTPPARTITLTNLPSGATVQRADTMGDLAVTTASGGATITPPAGVSRVVVRYVNGYKRFLDIPATSGSVDASPIANLMVSNITPNTRIFIASTQQDISTRPPIDGFNGRAPGTWTVSLPTDGFTIPEIVLNIPFEGDILAVSRRPAVDPSAGPSQPIVIDGRPSPAEVEDFRTEHTPPPSETPPSGSGGSGSSGSGSSGSGSSGSGGTGSGGTGSGGTGSGGTGSDPGTGETGADGSTEQPPTDGDTPPDGNSTTTTNITLDQAPPSTPPSVPDTSLQSEQESNSALMVGVGALAAVGIGYYFFTKSKKTSTKSNPGKKKAPRETR